MFEPGRCHGHVNITSRKIAFILIEFSKKKREKKMKKKKIGTVSHVA